MLRDQLRGTEDWEAAGHAYAKEHARYVHVNPFREPMVLRVLSGHGAKADARRARALPLIAEDPNRQPHAGFSGPDIPVDQAVKNRFFAED